MKLEYFNLYLFMFYCVLDLEVNCIYYKRFIFVVECLEYLIFVSILKIKFKYLNI